MLRLDDRSIDKYTEKAFKKKKTKNGAGEKIVQRLRALTARPKAQHSRSSSQL